MNFLPDDHLSYPDRAPHGELSGQHAAVGASVRATDANPPKGGRDAATAVDPPHASTGSSVIGGATRRPVGIDTRALRRELRGGGPAPDVAQLRTRPHVWHVQRALAAARARVARCARRRQAGQPLAAEHASALAAVREYRARLAELQVATW